MTRAVKVADVPHGENAAMVSASPTGMSFYALLNRSGSASASQPVPTLVQYSWTAGSNCLTETQTPGAAISNPADGGPYFQWPATGSTAKCLLRTATAPVFTYYASADLTATALPGSNLSAGNLALVRSVGLYLTATDPANPGVLGVPAENRVTLENLLVAGSGS